VSYRVQYDGTILVDTPEEALALQRQIVGKPTPPSTQHAHAAGSNGTSTAWPTYVKSLREGPRQLLAIVKKAGELTIGEAVTQLGAALAPKGKLTVAGYLTSISRNAKKVGLDTRKVLRSKTTGYAQERVVTLHAGAILEANDL
jgi:hypothetical protein